MRRLIRDLVAITAVLAGVAVAKADWEFNSRPDAYPYKFGPSALVPKWSETNVGEWTFNYEGALAKAKAEGKYTLLLFAGFWWCPHCQALDEILVKDEFKSYVAGQGYYLAALDFPFRDGHSMWTWLWDPAYRAANGIGDWTPQQIADEYVKRFEFQDLMHAPDGITTTNNNVLVEISADGSTTNLAVYAENPTTVYRRIGFPTIVVISPDGEEIGRFEYSLTTDPEEGLSCVIGNIETIKAAGRGDLFANPGAGGIEGAAAQTYDAVLMDSNGGPAGTATFKTAKRDRVSGIIKVTGSVQMADGRLGRRSDQPEESRYYRFRHGDDWRRGGGWFLLGRGGQLPCAGGPQPVQGKGCGGQGPRQHPEEWILDLCVDECRRQQRQSGGRVLVVFRLRDREGQGQGRRLFRGRQPCFRIRADADGRRGEGAGARHRQERRLLDDLGV